MELEKELSINSDRPETDLERDAYGFAPVAKKIAEVVLKAEAAHGLVLAITGKWGSGKSTLLNFVMQQIRLSDKPNKPIVVEFNPWWFKTHEDLATQFLAAFQAEVRSHKDLFKDLGNALGKYADALGTTATIATGMGPVGSAVRWFFGLFRSAPQTVPQSKKEIAKRISESGRRFVFVIDDIDRLVPADVASLFRVIKSLADFPNVVYILSYDRAVVASSIRETMNVDGDAYLEKVIQSSFVVPAIDQIAIRKKLFFDLDLLLESNKGVEFDKSYWAQIYFDGVDPFIRVPRDVVRLINSLLVTFPVVAGEVNPIDFIALEVLRLYTPSAYDIVRLNQDYFTGQIGSDKVKREAIKSFHERWLAGLEKEPIIRKLLGHVFPKFGHAMENFFFESGSRHWRRDLRVCSPDIFPTYFQLAVSPGGVTQGELARLILAGEMDQESARRILLLAGVEKNQVGVSRASEFLDRISDFEDSISVAAAKGLLSALFDVGDRLLSKSDEESQGLMSVPNRWRLRWVVASLMRRIPIEDLPPLLENWIADGKAIALIVDVVDSFDARLNKGQDEDDVFSRVSSEFCEELKNVVCKRFYRLGVDEVLLLPDVDYILHRCARWCGLNVVRQKVLPILLDKAKVLRLLEGFLGYSRIQSGNDPIIKKNPRLNPKLLCELVDPDWLDLVVDEAANELDLDLLQEQAVEAYRTGRNAKSDDDD